MCVCLCLYYYLDIYFMVNKACNMCELLILTKTVSETNLENLAYNSNQVKIKFIIAISNLSLYIPMANSFYLL